MYVATTKDEGNAADGRFSTACCTLILFQERLEAGRNLRPWLLFPPDYLLLEIIPFSYAIMFKKISFTRIFSD
jgi:hypothetical protein